LAYDPIKVRKPI